MLQVAVRKQLGAFTLQADFTAPTPGIVALFGRSGCGKSTLVNLISGLLAPDEGRVQLGDAVLTDTHGGICVPVEKRAIGYVFQDPRLFPHLNVLANLRYGAKRAARRRATLRYEAGSGRGSSIDFDGVVELLGLTRLVHRRPHQLSGGERQRVSLARALLSQPQLLLLDEPLASVDVARREEVLPYLEALRDHFSLPMVYVSHQFEEVLQLATHVVLLDAGKVVAQGTLAELSLRQELRAIVGPDLVGSVVDGVVTRTDPSHGLIELKLGHGTLHVGLQRVEVGSHARVQLLARDIILATQKPHGLSVRNELEGVVAELTHDDYDAVLVKVDIGGPIILSRITQDAVSALQLRQGSRVWVLVKAVSTRGHAFRIPAA